MTRWKEAAINHGKKIISNFPISSLYAKLSREGTAELAQSCYEAGADHGAKVERERILEILRMQSFRNNLTCHEWADFLYSKLREEDDK